MSTEPIRIPYGPGTFQFGDLWLPPGAGPHPVALVIHGGFWKAQYSLDLMDPMSRDFASRGLASWNIEYRRVGHEGGAWPGTLQDVAAAADSLRAIAPTCHLDLSRVVSIGHSAGGHLALWLAGRHKLPASSPIRGLDPLALKGAISLAGVTDMHLMWEIRQENSPVANLLGGAPGEVPDRYAETSPILLQPLGVPTVLVHGIDDDIVPILLSQRYKAAAADRAELIELPGVEHFGVIDPSGEAWRPIAAAMARLMV
jgi:acetyl esterase/lipase